MPAPLLPHVGRLLFRQNKAGRWYDTRTGRLVAVKTAERELRRGPGGRFRRSTGRFADTNRRVVEQGLRDFMGKAPPGGLTWFQVAEKYEERFGDVVDDILEDEF